MIQKKRWQFNRTEGYRALKKVNRKLLTRGYTAVLVRQQRFKILYSENKAMLGTID